jgi:hypothetical protein
MKQMFAMMAMVFLCVAGLNAKGTADADVQKVKEGAIGGYEVSIGKAYDTAAAATGTLRTNAYLFVKKGGKLIDKQEMNYHYYNGNLVPAKTEIYLFKSKRNIVIIVDATYANGDADQSEARLWSFSFDGKKLQKEVHLNLTIEPNGTFYREMEKGYTLAGSALFPLMEPVMIPLKLDIADQKIARCSYDGVKEEEIAKRFEQLKAKMIAADKNLLVSDRMQRLDTEFREMLERCE